MSTKDYLKAQEDIGEYDPFQEERWELNQENARAALERNQDEQRD